MSSHQKIRLGVSACLLGQEVRFDGGHKRDAFLSESLAPFVEWVPVCPEDEAGLGTPREAMRLERSAEGIRVITRRSRHDVTGVLQRYAAARMPALGEQDLDGFILKKDSPSCGLSRVAVYTPDGSSDRTGRGIFASALGEALPSLPVEDEGRLRDPILREHFFCKVYAWQRLRHMVARRPRLRELIEFHSRHKLLVLAHSPEGYSALGRLVAGARGAQGWLSAYAQVFMTALSSVASRGRHANTLQHLAGHLRQVLPDAARQDVAQAIGDYQNAIVPLVVPVRLISHYAGVHGLQYLSRQVYLRPYPDELRLRNHI